MDTFFDDWPFISQVALVLFLLALSGFFSMAETSMLSSNRHRLRAMAHGGNAGAALAERLLKRIDSLLSVLLISNNLINTILPILVTGIALHIFGDSGLVLSIATLVVALLIIIFSEITPKVIGAAFPEKPALSQGARDRDVGPALRRPLPLSSGRDRARCASFAVTRAPEDARRGFRRSCRLGAGELVRQARASTPIPGGTP